MPRRRPPHPDPLSSAAGQLGQAIPPADAQEIAERRRDVTSARIAHHIGRILSDVPPLTAEQAARIAGLLRPRGDAR